MMDEVTRKPEPFKFAYNPSLVESHVPTELGRNRVLRSVPRNLAAGVVHVAKIFGKS